MFFTYSEITVLDCLKPLTLSAVGNDDWMLQNKFFVVYKFTGVGTLLTAKCPGSVTRGMLAAGIDPHITNIKLQARKLHIVRDK